MLNHEYYAHAFYQASASDRVNRFKELSAIATLFQDYPQLTSTLLFDSQKISEVESWLFSGVAKETKSFFKIVVEDGIVDQIERIRSKVRELLIQDELWTICLVEVAQEITEETYLNIQTLVKQNYKGFVEFELITNSSLKAGYRLFINDTMIDLSVSGRLERLVEEVTNE